jgi:chemotaxis protein histidine kinase CheA
LDDPARDLHFVITGSMNGGRTALVVDEILDVEDTVIKSLAPQFNPHGIYRGATFLDDGTIGLILDMARFIERAGGASRPVAPAVITAADTAARDKSFLIFDLGIAGRYAIEQEVIFRVEELDLSATHALGRFRVLPYRGGALSMLELEDLLNPVGPRVGPAAGSTLVVVVQVDETYVGFPVRTIVDVANPGEFKDDVITPSRYLNGQALWNDRVVSLINWTELAAAVTRISA